MTYRDPDTGRFARKPGVYQDDSPAFSESAFAEGAREKERARECRLGICGHSACLSKFMAKARQAQFERAQKPWKNH